MSPAPLRFVPLGAEEVPAWLAEQRAGYVAERRAAGDSVAEATANADDSLGRLFPGGAPAPGQLVGRLVEGGAPVGLLWLGPFGPDPSRWWVWEVAVDEAHRGRGLGRAAMLMAEDLARRAGATSLGLNVFGHNGVARHLYASLGYEDTAVQMRKDL